MATSMVMITLQRERMSGQDGWKQHPQKAWPRPEKELLVPTPFPLAFLMPPEHKKAEIYLDKNC